MATAQETVRRALVLLGVLAGGEQASADAMQDGVAALNDMLFSWANKGADLGHSTVAQGDTLLVEDAFLRGIRYNLAVDLAPEYGVAIPPSVALVAIETFADIQAKTLEFDDDLTVDRTLHPRYFRRRIGSYNVNEG